MAKAKPKKSAKTKKPVKPIAKPKSKRRKKEIPIPPIMGIIGPGKPLIIGSDGVENFIAIEWLAGFPTDPLTGVPITQATHVTDSSGVAFSSVGCNFTGTTILNVSFWGTRDTSGLYGSGILQIALTNPPSSPFPRPPVPIPVDYISDDDLPEPPDPDI